MNERVVPSIKWVQADITCLWGFLLPQLNSLRLTTPFLSIRYIPAGSFKKPGSILTVQCLCYFLFSELSHNQIEELPSFHHCQKLEEM